MIVSVDPGWRCCAISTIGYSTERAEVEWLRFALVDLVRRKSMVTIEKMINHFVEELDRVLKPILAQNPSTDIIGLCEMQPPRNKKTKILSHAMQAVFVSKGHRFAFVSPKQKLKGQKKMDYAQRKAWSTRTCSAYLLSAAFPGVGQIRDAFARLSKKDDIADSIVQALCHLQAGPYSVSSSKKISCTK